MNDKYRSYSFVDKTLALSSKFKNTYTHTETTSMFYGGSSYNNS